MTGDQGPPSALSEIPFLEYWGCRPATQDGRALCDLALVLGNEVFFFKEVEGPSAGGEDPEARREAARRWKKEILDPALGILANAREHVLGGGRVYGDPVLKPADGLVFHLPGAKVRMFAVTNGRGPCPEDAGAEFAVSYGDPSRGDDGAFLRFDKDLPFHVLGRGIFGELDTLPDFFRYATEKEEAIGRHDFVACGTEEDLLALYLEGRLAGPKSGAGKRGSLIARAGTWKEFRESPVCRDLEELREAARPWNDLEREARRRPPERTADFDAVSPWRISNPAAVIAAQPLALRAAISENMLKAMEEFAEDSAYEFQISQTEIDPEICYVFMQTRRGEDFEGTDDDYRKLRLETLETGCGMAKNEFPQVLRVVGVAREVPGSGADVENELILFDCSSWGENERILYGERNHGVELFPGREDRPFPLPAETARPSQGTLFPPTRVEALTALGDAAREGRRLLREKGFGAAAARGRWAETVGRYLETVFGLRGGGRNLLSGRSRMKEGFIELCEIYGLLGVSPRHVLVSEKESDAMLRGQVEIVESTILGLGGTLPERAKPGTKPKKRRAKRPKSGRPKKKKKSGKKR